MLTSCQCYIFFSLSNVVIYVKLFEKYENKIEIEIEIDNAISKKAVNKKDPRA